MRAKKIIIALSFLIAIAFYVPTVANGQALQDPQGAPQVAAPQDPISRLRLTPDQRQKIRAIREQNKEERAATNQRFRESTLALEQALDSDNPDESVIEQRLKEVDAAQSAQTRMRVFTELRIRRVLTQEQLTVWRQMRLQAAAQRRAELMGNAPNNEDGRPRNGMNQLFPQRNRPQRTPRP